MKTGLPRYAPLLVAKSSPPGGAAAPEGGPWGCRKARMDLAGSSIFGPMETGRDGDIRDPDAALACIRLRLFPKFSQVALRYGKNSLLDALGLLRCGEYGRRRLWAQFALGQAVPTGPYTTLSWSVILSSFPFLRTIAMPCSSSNRKSHIKATQPSGSLITKIDRGTTYLKTLSMSFA